ncbi:ankyrin repeat domain-containing protein [Coraliomargarita sp. SDUM461003]|uniref:Ankyrin repeat domain-containing protein n=1 Tax=Thalassobacterium maritimum TaxID=3041265 RepID=A0ABU1AVX9_9BACT|nr:ankyrin repeat domain-containing protein [Coraliomargarita sp. SDUM461003]MDQ8208306.1 ankyrin repeat domain-containing protein [Coraliomargarita sp. SDUM461003]
MRSHAPIIFLLCLSALFASAQSPNYFELDLRKLDGEQGNFPDWLEEITESSGEFDPEFGWQLDASKPFGIGRLYLSLDRNQLTHDLALSFFSQGTANIAVQLYDANERTLAVDLLAARTTVDEASLTSLVIPLSEYPNAKHIVLRRLEGAVAVSALSLIELTAPSPQNEASITHLASLLGDPLAPENPLIASVQEQATADQSQALISARPTFSRPLSELSKLEGEAHLHEDELISILQVLGLQGYDFNAIDFVQAAGEGREEVVRLYLRAGMPINVQGRNKYTAVAEAATSGELRVLKLLCDRGADLEIRTAGGNSALWMACISSHYEAIRLLVENGADVNARGAYGNTPLLKVINRRAHNYNKADEYTVFLLEHGADPNIADNRGETMLHEVVRHGKASMLQIALDYNGDPTLKDNAGFTPMMAAKYRNSKSLIQTLLNHGVPEWEPDQLSLDEQLVYHIYRREYSEAYKLLDAGASPNATDMNGEHILFNAINKRNLTLIRKLRTYGLDLNVRDLSGRSPLGHVHSGFHKSREAMVDYFLEEGLDPNYATQEELRKKKPYYTPLMNAASAGNADRCQRLLAAGANPTTKNLPGRTAAIIAERAGFYQLSQELQAAESKWTANE